MRLLELVLVKHHIAFVEVVVSRGWIVCNSFFVLLESILHVSLVIVCQTQVFMVERKILGSSVRVLLYKFSFEFDGRFIGSECGIKFFILKVRQP